MNPVELPAIPMRRQAPAPTAKQIKAFQEQRKRHKERQKLYSSLCLKWSLSKDFDQKNNICARINALVDQWNAEDAKGTGVSNVR